MGSFNCTGFHSRLPITGGDEIVLILGLHQTAKHTVKYAFDPIVFAPDITFTPIALPVYCKYDDCRHVCDVVRDKNVETIEKFFGESFIDIIRNCDNGEEVSMKLAEIVDRKFDLPAGEYQLTYTFDHRFVYDEVAAMKLPLDWEKSYVMTLEHSDLSAGPENKKYSADEIKLLEIAETMPESDEKSQMQELLEDRQFFHIGLDMIFRTYNQIHGWGHTVANLNPKHIGTTIYQANESYMGELLLALYRYHADVLFLPELKPLLLGFMNFYQALHRYGWSLTLPVYAGQEERYSEIAPLYRKMAEWVEGKVEDYDNDSSVCDLSYKTI